MLGIGTDILAMDRFRNVLLAGGDAFIREVYAESEQKAAESREDRERFYATHFAGKEAVFKCLDATWEHGLKLRDIEILYAPNGAPRVLLHGPALDAAKLKGIGQVLLSLSYEREYAVAMAAARAERRNALNWRRVRTVRLSGEPRRKTLQARWRTI